MIVHSIEESDKWDSLVKSFREYDVYYLSGYVKAFEINGDGEPQLYYFENATTRAINVVMKRDLFKETYFHNKVKEGEYFDLVTPYGYGGWIIEGKNGHKPEEEALQKDYLEYCKKEGIICEFVRFHPLLKNEANVSNIYEEIYCGDTVYMDTRSKEIIWANLISKNRNMIRKAQKEGLTVGYEGGNEMIPTFMEIYNDTMDRDNASEYYYFKQEFYQSVVNDLSNNAMWFYVKYEEEIIAVAIFMFCNGKMHYHLSASRKEYQKFAPTNLMLYKAAVWASENGYEFLHLGGGVGANKDSLYKFKKAFNRQEDTNFYVGRCVFDEQLYQKVVAIREIESEIDKNSNYFPIYRAPNIKKMEGNS